MGHILCRRLIVSMVDYNISFPIKQFPFVPCNLGLVSWLGLTLTHIHNLTNNVQVKTHVGYVFQDVWDTRYEVSTFIVLGFFLIVFLTLTLLSFRRTYQFGSVATVYINPSKKIQRPSRQNIRAILKFVETLEHPPYPPRCFQYCQRAAFASSASKVRGRAGFHPCHQRPRPYASPSTGRVSMVLYLYRTY